MFNRSFGIGEEAVVARMSQNGRNDPELKPNTAEI
jgi:hypothetical protein